MSDPSFQALVTSLAKKKKRAILITGISSIVVGVAVLYIRSIITVEGESTGYLLLGIVFCVMGVLSFLSSFRSDPFVHAALKEPSKIAWAYTEKVSDGEGGQKRDKLRVVIRYTNKKKSYFELKTTKAEELYQGLQKNVPHATFGYSKEIRKKYKQDPSSLIQ